MRRFVVVTLLLLVTVTACFAVQKSSRAKAEDDIRDAVFRYQIHHYKADVYFLAISDRDPSSSFMTRFKGCKPPVKKQSESKLDPGRGIKDRRTGARGVVLHSEAVKWLNKNTVEVTGDYFQNMRAGSGWIFRVALKNGRWVVTEAKCKAIY